MPKKKQNTFETDLLFPVLQEVSKLGGILYTGKQINKESNLSDSTDVYLKIITDHARCITFLIADGIRMSNIGRGYVLRFITRRAARFGRLLGLKEAFLYKLVPSVVSVYGQYYKELVSNKELIEEIIKEEEEKFARTIEKGSNILDDLIANSDKELDGKAVFNLYSTYGFPLELTREIAKEHGKNVDISAFEKAKEEHGEISSVNKFNVNIVSDDFLSQLSSTNGGTQFVGYEKLESDTEVIGITKNGKMAEEIAENEEAEVILDNTPFYAESGGQLGDKGILESKDVRLRVLETKKNNQLHIHKVRVESGFLRKGDKLQAIVDNTRRQSTVLHHSAAHLFHAAIRELFGKSVTQAGSQVGPDTMRFDFTLDKQPTAVELQKIENMMSDWTRSNAPVETNIMSLNEAKNTGAIAMFGEKYGDKVRVVKMGDFSLEFCGGTHALNVGQIGPIKIISEGSVASGVRRVEAVAGQVAWQYILQQLSYLSNATNILKSRPADLASQIEKLKEQLKEKDRLTNSLQEQLALTKLPELLSQVKSVGKYSVICSNLGSVSADNLKTLAMESVKQVSHSIILLMSVPTQEKVAIVCAVDPDLVKAGINAGVLVKNIANIIGGSGGGRPDFAQAGGIYPDKIPEALNAFCKELADHNGDRR